MRLLLLLLAIVLNGCTTEHPLSIEEKVDLLMSSNNFYDTYTLLNDTERKIVFASNDLTYAYATSAIITISEKRVKDEKKLSTDEVVTLGWAMNFLNNLRDQTKDEEFIDKLESAVSLALFLQFNDFGNKKSGSVYLQSDDKAEKLNKPF